MQAESHFRAKHGQQYQNKLRMDELKKKQEWKNTIYHKKIQSKLNKKMYHKPCAIYHKKQRYKYNRW